MFGIIRDAVRAVWSAITRAKNLAAENVALHHQLGVVLRPTRSRPRLKLKLRDRVLLVWLSRIWSGWKDAVRIVQPETVIGWHHRGWRLYWTWKSKRRKPGRPPVPQDVRELIRTISSQNVTWGAPRVHGEILKLGISVSQATVAKYMVRHEKPPSQNWRTFLDNHVATLASIDFFTVPTIRFGVLYIFLVLAHDRRRIRHFNVTTNPTAEWTARQITEAFPEDSAPRYMIRDRDDVYGDIFRGRVKALGIEEVLIAPHSPWQNPYVERLIGTLRREALDHIIVRDEQHLRRVLREYLGTPSVNDCPGLRIETRLDVLHAAVPWYGTRSRPPGRRKAAWTTRSAPRGRPAGERTEAPAVHDMGSSDDTPIEPCPICGDAECVRGHETHRRQRVGVVLAGRGICPLCQKERRLVYRGEKGMQICRRCFGQPKVVSYGACSCCQRTNAEICFIRSDGERICKHCYHAPLEECVRCGRLRPVGLHTETGPICSDCYKKSHPRTVERCVGCGREQVVEQRTAEGPICSMCYQRVHKPPQVFCVRCGREGRTAKLTPAGPIGDCCYSRPLALCFRCGKEKEVKSRTEQGAVCSRCYQRLHPPPKRVCIRCGNERTVRKVTPEGPVCQSCHPPPMRVCVFCGCARPTPYRHAEGRVCRSCHEKARRREKMETTARGPS